MACRLTEVILYYQNVFGMDVIVCVWLHESLVNHLCTIRHWVYYDRKRTSTRTLSDNWRTVMRIIKLKIFQVPVRLHSGYDKLIFVIFLPFLQYL